MKSVSLCFKTEALTLQSIGAQDDQCDYVKHLQSSNTLTFKDTDLTAAGVHHYHIDNPEHL